MVTLTVKFPGRKIYRQYHPNLKSALKTKRFIGKEAETAIVYRGKPILSNRPKIKRRTSRPSFNLNRFDFRI